MKKHILMLISLILVVGLFSGCAMKDNVGKEVIEVNFENPSDKLGKVYVNNDDNKVYYYLPLYSPISGHDPNNDLSVYLEKDDKNIWYRYYNIGYILINKHYPKKGLKLVSTGSCCEYIWKFDSFPYLVIKDIQYFNNKRELFLLDKLKFLECNQKNNKLLNKMFRTYIDNIISSQGDLDLYNLIYKIKNKCSSFVFDDKVNEVLKYEYIIKSKNLNELLSRLLKTYKENPDFAYKLSRKREKEIGKTIKFFIQNDKVTNKSILLAKNIQKYKKIGTGFDKWLNKVISYKRDMYDKLCHKQTMKYYNKLGLENVCSKEDFEWKGSFDKNGNPVGKGSFICVQGRRIGFAIFKARTYIKFNDIQDKTGILKTDLYRVYLFGADHLLSHKGKFDINYLSSDIDANVKTCIHEHFHYLNSQDEHLSSDDVHSIRVKYEGYDSSTKHYVYNLYVNNSYDGQIFYYKDGNSYVIMTTGISKGNSVNGTYFTSGYNNLTTSQCGDTHVSGIDEAINKVAKCVYKGHY